MATTPEVPALFRSTSPSRVLAAFVAIHDALAQLEPAERIRAIDAALIILEGQPMSAVRRGEVISIVNSAADC
jgi:hypothetical protein